MIQLLIQRWRRCAVDLCVLLVLVQLPLALLFSLQARLFYQTPWELIEDTALLVAVYAVVAALLGLAVALAAAVLQPLGQRRAEQLIALARIFFCAMVVLSLQPFAQKWWWQMQGLMQNRAHFISRINIVPYLLGLALIAAVLATWRRGLVTTGQRISASLQNGARPTLAVVAVCTALAGVTGHMHWRGFGWSAPADVAAVASPGAPDVILISIDTLAASDMSLYGYRLPTTPNLDRFARGGYVFDHFMANSNYTTPTVTSMLTGRYPTSHTVYQHYAGVRPGQRAFNLAEVLRSRGYATAAVVSNPMAHPLNINIGDSFDYLSAIPNAEPGHQLFRLFGFDRADLVAFMWDWWLGPVVREIVPRIPLDSVQRAPWFPPAPVIAEAREVLSAHRRPIFLWTHFFAPHEPYVPPKPYMGSFLPTGDYDTLYEIMQKTPIAGLYTPASQPLVDQLRLRYDENISYVDHEVGSFIDELEKSGLLRNALVIVTADHGESFAKGWRGHSGPMLNQGLLHVPLIVRLPQQAAGARVASNAEQVDLLPTVLDVLKIPRPAWSDGESLLPAMRDGAISSKTKFSMAVDRSPRFQPLTNGTVAVVQGSHKLIRYLGSGCEELYDLDADPTEQISLLGAQPDTAAALRAAIPGLIGVPVPPAPPDADCSRPWLDHG